MDPTEIESLERGFWSRLAAGLLVGVLALAAALWLAQPVPNAWLAAIHGLLAVAFLGFGTVTLRLGNRIDAAGQATAAVGWTVLAVGAVRGAVGG